MGVEHYAMTFAGEYFETVEEVATMLIERGVLVIPDGQTIDDMDSDWITHLTGLDMRCENCWSGHGYYVGFEAGDWKGYQSLLDEYKRITGQDGEIHDFVQVS